MRENAWFAVRFYAAGRYSWPQQGLFMHVFAERLLLPYDDPFATVHDGEQ
jgi:hypothetical protein